MGITEMAKTPMSHLKTMVARARKTTVQCQRFMSQWPKAKLQKIRAKVLGNGRDM